MKTKLRLLMGATALLYLGPLLAGLGGFGWAVVPVFTLIFVLWLIVLRPHQWPRRPADWTAQVAVVAVTQALVQVLLVAVCFGIGRGIGGVLEFLPPFPVMLPVAVSFLSIPLSRLVWDPWKAAELDQFLDDAIRQISNPADRPSNPEWLDDATARILALPPDTSDAEAEAAINSLKEMNYPVMDALLEALDKGGPAARAGRRGLILWSTDPARVLAQKGRELPEDGFSVTWLDPELTWLFLRRAHPLIVAHPALWADFPSSRDLHFAMDDSNDPALNAALRAMADAVEQATPEHLRDDDSDSVTIGNG